MNIQMMILAVDLLIALVVGLASFRKSRRSTARVIAILALFVAIWTLCELLLDMPGLSRWALALAAGIYLSCAVAASAQFVYVVQLSNREHWIGRLPLALLAVMPVLTQILYWIRPWHNFLFGNSAPNTALVLFLAGAWGKVTVIYIFGR